MSFVRESVMVGGRPLTFETGRSPSRRTAPCSSPTARASCSSPPSPARSGPASTSSRSPASTSRRRTPPARSRAASSSARAACATTRSSPAASWTARCRPLFPEGYKKRHADHRDRALVRQGQPDRRARAHRRERGAAHLGHPVGRPDRRHPRRAHRRRVHRVPDVRAAARRPTSTSSSPCTKDAIVMVEGGAAEAQRDRPHRRADVRAPARRSRSSSSSRSMRAAVGKPKRAFSAPKLDRADRAGASPALVDARSARRLRHQGEEGALRRATATIKKKRRRDAAPPSSAPRSALERREARQGGVRRAQVPRRARAACSTRASASTAATPRRSARSCCEVGPPAARARLGALPARRDAGDRDDDARHRAATSRRSTRSPARRWKRFLLHYNFPPFSTGETKPMRGPGRREIGHGALAERALVAHDPGARGVPVHDPHRLRDPRVERLVLDGRACAAAPLASWTRRADQGAGRRHRDGPHHGRRAASPILTDILGDEDHLGDMDFKVCGTERGITAIQMDIKIAGPRARDPRAGARSGARRPPAHPRQDARDACRRRAPSSRSTRRASRPSRSSPIRSASSSAPAARPSRASSTRPASRSTSRTTARSTSPSRDSDAVKRAIDIIEGLTAEPEVGAIYKGTVKRIADFGAFVEILPNTDGLLHVSEIAHERVETRRGRPEGGRRGRGEGHQRRPRRQDPPLAPRALALPRGRRRRARTRAHPRAREAGPSGGRGGRARRRWSRSRPRRTRRWRP